MLGRWVRVGLDLRFRVQYEYVPLIPLRKKPLKARLLPKRVLQELKTVIRLMTSGTVPSR